MLTIRTAETGVGNKGIRIGKNAKMYMRMDTLTHSVAPSSRRTALHTLLNLGVNCQGYATTKTGLHIHILRACPTAAIVVILDNTSLHSVNNGAAKSTIHRMCRERVGYLESY